MRAYRVVLAAGMVLGLGLSAGAAWGDQWTQPTKEELAMTSLPEVPGAPALYLYREEKTIDHLHVYSVYVRMKILTEGGKKYANVELPYWGMDEEEMGIGEVAGRTVHPDGTVIPFTGKPYVKVMEKGKDSVGDEFSVKTKVFTLPDVTVGSVIEYRYNLRWSDHYYRNPTWEVQTDLYLRKGYFLWKPTSHELVTTTNGKHEKVADRLAWIPILPAGAAVKRTEIPGNSLQTDDNVLMELNVENVKPAPEEDYMPPLASFRYKVEFYYAAYRNEDEFWKNSGKDWASDEEHFIGHGDGVKAAVAHLVAPADTQEQKLKKIYASVMELENTDFTRAHSRAEDKSQGLSKTKTTDDVLEHKRGSGDELAALFVAMARDAGMKAYVMGVTPRDRDLFFKSFMSLYQLRDVVAIVEVDGKEQFFDPGSRYCPYGRLAWQHTMVQGLREKEGGTELSQTPGESYKQNVQARVANLTLDEQGIASGKINLSFIGQGALGWRHRALTGDKESIDRELKEYLEAMMPANMEVKVLSIEKLEAYEEPLQVNYEVKGAIGAGTGKRLMIPADLFEGNEKPKFVHETRETAVMLEYPSVVRDAVRVNFPKSFEAESIPTTDNFSFEKHALYQIKTEKTATSVTARRDLMMGEFLFFAPEYKDLRGFYTKFESKDQEPMVLKVVPAGAPAAGN